MIDCIVKDSEKLHIHTYACGFIIPDKAIARIGVVALEQAHAEHHNNHVGRCRLQQVEGEVDGGYGLKCEPVIND